MAELGALARQSAVVMPRGMWETLLVTGPDRRSWLQGLVTCDVEQLGEGQGTWGLALNRQGKIQSVLSILASPDALWLALAPGTSDAVLEELSRMLIMEDAELGRPSHAHSWFALHGPEAASRAARLAELAAGYSAPIDWTGLGGAALLVPKERSSDVIGACQDELLGEHDWLRLRLERGVPEFGTDFDSQDRPHEAALERRAVSWSKGCYLGQEVVCMQDMRGKVKRSLRVLAVAAPADAGLNRGALVLSAADQNVGTVTSAAFSEQRGSWLAMARLKLDGLDEELRCVPKAPESSAIDGATPPEPNPEGRAQVTWPARLAEPN